MKRVIKWFKEKKFRAGEFLLKEGAVADRAYIIKEGECKFIKRNEL